MVTTPASTRTRRSVSWVNTVAARRIALRLRATRVDRMSTEVADPPVLEARDEGVLTLTLNRPKVLNAITDGLLDAVADSLRAAATDGEVRAVVITGAGRAFCSGH